MFNLLLPMTGSTRILAVALLAMIGSCATPSSSAPGCALSTQPEILRSLGEPQAIGSELVQVWNFRVEPSPFAEAAPAAIRDFQRDILQLGIDVNPLALLRQEAEVSNASIAHNNAVVAAHARQWIGPARCVELVLLDRQYQRVLPIRQSTEFGALILRRGHDWRIYQITQNIDAIRNAGVLFEVVARDVETGWTLEASLHNHNLAFDPNTPRGAIAPSESDAAMNINLRERFGLQEAWITNGFHTVRIPSASFDLFLPPPGE